MCGFSVVCALFQLNFCLTNKCISVYNNILFGYQSVLSFDCFFFAVRYL